MYHLNLLKKAIKESVVDSVAIFIGICRFMIPISIITKILVELDLIKYLALPLSPIMNLVGLPAELGLAWATGMVLTLYPAIILLLGLLPTIGPLTVEQMTTFGLMLLLAHSLILETKIAGMCGVSMTFQCVLRLVMAIVGGLIVHGIGSTFGIWQTEAVVLLEGSPPENFAQWVVLELENLVKVFFIICGVLLAKRGMDYFKITDFLAWLLRPLLHLVGISTEAIRIIIVGFSMGILYGSGIIVKEIQAGKLTQRDILCSITLMSLVHALIEDSFILALLGCSLWGIIGLRVLLALIVGMILNWYTERQEKKMNKYSRT